VERRGRAGEGGGGVGRGGERGSERGEEGGRKGLIEWACLGADGGASAKRSNPVSERTNRPVNKTRQTGAITSSNQPPYFGTPPTPHRSTTIQPSPKFCDNEPAARICASTSSSRALSNDSEGSSACHSSNVCNPGWTLATMLRERASVQVRMRLSSSVFFVIRVCECAKASAYARATNDSVRGQQHGTTTTTTTTATTETVLSTHHDGGQVRSVDHAVIAVLDVAGHVEGLVAPPGRRHFLPNQFDQSTT
jgi:hypothetical protein